MIEEIKFRKAEYKDIEELIAIRDRCADGLKEMGVDQWQNKEPHVGLIKSDIEQGRGYLFESEDRIVAYFTLILGDEKEYREFISGDIAGKTAAIHRVMVDTEFRGRAFAQRVFTEAGRMAADAGKKFLFVDTHAKNKPMLKSIERHGFSYLGVIEIDTNEGHDKKRSAFSKEILM